MLRDEVQRLYDEFLGEPLGHDIGTGNSAKRHDEDDCNAKKDCVREARETAPYHHAEENRLQRGHAGQSGQGHSAGRSNGP